MQFKMIILNRSKQIFKQIYLTQKWDFPQVLPHQLIDWLILTVTQCTLPFTHSSRREE